MPTTKPKYQPVLAPRIAELLERRPDLLDLPLPGVVLLDAIRSA